MRDASDYHHVKGLAQTLGWEGDFYGTLVSGRLHTGDYAHVFVRQPDLVGATVDTVAPRVGRLR